MLEGTFQLGRGLGPVREQRLWSAGLASWSDFEGAPEKVPAPARERLKRLIASLRRAHHEGDVVAVAAAVPRREHWRLVPWLIGAAAFLDIETAYDGEVTAVGIWGARGPEIFMPHGCSGGRPLEGFISALEGVELLVTYNGASFDVPVLRKHFPRWEPPPVHVDLCHLWRRLGHRGGLKTLERAQGIVRPGALDGLDGSDAAHLWHAGLRGDRRALQRFAAYNLADAAHLRPLLALAYNRLSAELGRDWRPLAVIERGDMLYDLSQALLGLEVPRPRERAFPASMPTRLF